MRTRWHDTVLYCAHNNEENRGVKPRRVQWIFNYCEPIFFQWCWGSGIARISFMEALNLDPGDTNFPNNRKRSSELNIYDKILPINRLQQKSNLTIRFLHLKLIISIFLFSLFALIRSYIRIRFLWEAKNV